jgi:hypothetical protein
MQIGMIVRHCVLVAAIAACAMIDGPSANDDSTFVATMARLHAIERNTALTEAARDSARRQVLQEQGLTTRELEALARGYSHDPAHAAAIWSAIHRKVLTLTGDSATTSTSGVPLQEETR